MPCGGGGPSPEEIREEKIIRASLCAILTLLEQQGLLEKITAKCDWTEAGVARSEMFNWFDKHKRADAKRRKWERQERERKATAQAAKERLTPAERKALGIK